MKVTQEKLRFTNYKQIEIFEDDKSQIEHINMTFDNLEINLVTQNFDNIVDKLIEDIDNLRAAYLEKYKNYDLGLHIKTDNELKDLILNIGLEKILGEKDFNNMISQVECIPAKETADSGATNVNLGPGPSRSTSRIDQQALPQTNEPYNESHYGSNYTQAFQINMTKPKTNRIPYAHIEHINVAVNILNLDNVDPQDWEKPIKRWEKGCLHSAIMLDFQSTTHMLDYFEHTLDDMVFN